MKLTTWIAIVIALTSTSNVFAKTFQNSFVSFEVPDNWSCSQVGVAWICNPLSVVQAKEAVIVIAAKVAGPEDNLTNFKSFLSQPKRIATKVGTPMPSKVMYAQDRFLAGTKWVQAQHLGSEIQDYYTLYLATVKDQLAMLVTFSADHDRYPNYNPIFDHAMKTLKIVASQQLLFAKNASGSAKAGGTVSFGIQPMAPAAPINHEDLMPPPEKKAKGMGFVHVILALAVIGVGIGFYLSRSNRRTKSRPKSRPR